MAVFGTALLVTDDLPPTDDPSTAATLLVFMFFVISPTIDCFAACSLVSIRLCLLRLVFTCVSNTFFASVTLRRFGADEVASASPLADCLDCLPRDDFGDALSEVASSACEYHSSSLASLCCALVRCVGVVDLADLPCA